MYKNYANNTNVIDVVTILFHCFPLKVTSCAKGGRCTMRFLFVCMSIVVIVVPSVPMFKTLLETSHLICRGWKVSENYTMFVCLFVPMFKILLNKKVT